MRDLMIRYDVIGNDGIGMGEVVKGVFYNTQGVPDGGVLTERGLEDGSGRVLACWEDERGTVGALAYLSAQT